MTVPLPPSGSTDWYAWASQVDAQGRGAAQADDLATVATSGSYTDLSDQPTIPAGYTDEQVQDVVAALLAAGVQSGITFTYDDAGNAISATVSAQTWSQITGKPTFAAVATSGSASDITTGTLPDGVIPAGIARDTEVSTAVANLVNSAPGTLDTLGEIATALQSDESAAAALTTTVGQKADKSANLSDLASAPTARTNLGLGNVDNTSDVNKPVSTATQTALNGKISVGRLVFDVRDYGATGDGVTDDGPAIAAAATAAITARGILFFGAVSNYYSIQSTIVLRPTSGTQFYLDMLSASSINALQWDGGNNASMWDIKGWKRSTISNLRCRVASGKSNIVVWDLDGDATYTSLSQLTFIGCHVTGSTSTGVVGTRIGHTDPTNICDFSYLTWLNCHVSHSLVSSAAPTGTIGYLNEGPNSLDHKWFGGSIYNTDKGISNAVTSGASAAANTPGPTMFVYDLGTSHCNLDFEFITRGTYKISGGRYELGKKFLSTGVVTSAAGPEVLVDSVELVSYAPSDGVVFALNGGVGLVLDNITARPDSDGSQPDFTAAFITGAGMSTQRGSVIVRGGKLRCADPFWTFTSGNWALNRSAVKHMNSSLSTDYMFKDLLMHGGDNSDVVNIVNATGGSGSSGVSAFIGFQGTNASGSDTPRARIGYNSGLGAVSIEDGGGAGRPIAFSTAGSRRAQVLADGHFQFGAGVQYHRTVPGAFPYTALVTDHYLAVTTGSAKTINLPAAATAGAGHVFIIKDTTGGGATNNITVAANGTDTIDGAASRAINTAYGRLCLISDGVNAWSVLYAA